MAFVVLAIGVAFIVLTIGWLRIHPFLALILAALLVGMISPIPLMTGSGKELADEVAKQRVALDARLESGEIDRELHERLVAELPWKVQERHRDEAEIQRRVRVRREAIAGQVESGELTREEAEQRSAAVPAEVESQWGTEWEETGRHQRTQALLSMELTTQEFGATAGKIAIVIVLAAIIGQCLLESGAADCIVRRLLRVLGQGLASVAMLASGYVLSVPVFFDTVFFLLVPLSRALRLRVGKGFVLFVLAPCAGAVVTHSLVPPTPGPYVMVVDYFAPLGLDLGTAIGLGFLLGLVPAAAGLLFSLWVDRRSAIPMRDAPGATTAELEEIVRRDESELPSFLMSILPVVLPVVMITGHTVLEALRKGGYGISESVTDVTAFFGNPNVALLVATVLAAYTLVRQNKLSLGKLREKLEPAVTSAGVIILITSAGGAFGKMLSRTGVGDELGALARGHEFGPAGYLMLAWGIAVVMKIAQGSGTVSMITTATMVAGMFTEAALPCHALYLFAAIGFGSLLLSWMNDSGFWVVCKMSGFTEKETLCTWTPLLAVIGIVGIVEVLILAAVWPGI